MRLEPGLRLVVQHHGYLHRVVGVHRVHSHIIVRADAAVLLVEELLVHVCRVSLVALAVVIAPESSLNLLCRLVGVHTHGSHIVHESRDVEFLVCIDREQRVEVVLLGLVESERLVVERRERRLGVEVRQFGWRYEISVVRREEREIGVLGPVEPYLGLQRRAPRSVVRVRDAVCVHRREVGEVRRGCVQRRLHLRACVLGQMPDLERLTDFLLKAHLRMHRWRYESERCQYIYEFTHNLGKNTQKNENSKTLI